MENSKILNQEKRIEGCLFGGALGDSLGYPIEFEKMISKGNHLSDSPDISQFSDDTQMTLFTAEGIIKCKDEEKLIDYIFTAYKYWFGTQYFLDENHDYIYQSDLFEDKRLHEQRAPGNTCLSALRPRTTDNDSKGCGGVMRVAPIGLVFNYDKAFQYGCEAAKLTHKNSLGYIPAGIFAEIIARIVNEENIDDAILRSFMHSGNDEMIRILGNIQECFDKNLTIQESMQILGEGWTGDEALAIAVYCALKCDRYEISNLEKFKKALYMAAEHDGDSDSTASICGNILGAYYGINALPFPKKVIECSDIIDHIATRLLICKSKKELLKQLGI